jgi:hypothetical protein
MAKAARDADTTGIASFIWIPPPLDAIIAA